MTSYSKRILAYRISASFSLMISLLLLIPALFWFFLSIFYVPNLDVNGLNEFLESTKINSDNLIEMRNFYTTLFFSLGLTLIIYNGLNICLFLIVEHKLKKNDYNNRLFFGILYMIFSFFIPGIFYLKLNSDDFNEFSLNINNKDKKFKSILSDDEEKKYNNKIKIIAVVGAVIIILISLIVIIVESVNK